MAAFIDALTDGLPEEMQADVCIVGGGMAGHTIATQLSNTPLRILVLESGGLDIEGATQGLYLGNNTGLRYHDLGHCRLRYLGGTSNHWAGFCRPNDEMDYLGRPELGLPAWPINQAELTPYIERAASLLGLRFEGFDPRYQFERAGFRPSELMDTHSDTLVTKLFQIAGTLRATELFPLQDLPNVQVLLHANVTHIQLTPNGQQVDHVVVKTLDGKAGRARAPVFILATHGIENARLMLASNDIAPDGIGNASDQLGRNFMDHVYVHCSQFVPVAGRFPLAYDMKEQGARRLNFNLGLSEETLRREGLLQIYCRFRPIDLLKTQRLAFRHLNEGFFKPFDTALLEDIAAVASSLGNSARVVGEKLGMDPPPPELYLLDLRIEQAPNPNSRITLSEELDELGSRRADLHWELTELDYHTFQRGQEIVASELSALGVGRFQLDELTPEFINERVIGHYHHTGTTRMSSDPGQGVVDADCKVHGVGNLYVAGSSVFPTAGYSGPTMTLMSLAIRLADHLKETHV